jgi:NADH-quinone oxidoreductase subunit E
MTTEKILLDYDPVKKNLLPALKKISAVFEYISKKDAQKIADYFSTPLSKVYQTASFYDLIQTEKMPRVRIKVCSSVNCVLGESLKIIKEIENVLHIKKGDKNNSDINLESASCFGRCDEGPVVEINDKVYTKVTVSSVHGILEEWT